MPGVTADAAAGRRAGCAVECPPVVTLAAGAWGIAAEDPEAVIVAARIGEQVTTKTTKPSSATRLGRAVEGPPGRVEPVPGTEGRMDPGVNPGLINLPPAI
jgi:hypothetical protein